jgi:hypothetical protein
MKLPVLLMIFISANWSIIFISMQFIMGFAKILWIGNGHPFTLFWPIKGQE